MLNAIKPYQTSQKQTLNNQNPLQTNVKQHAFANNSTSLASYETANMLKLSRLAFTGVEDKPVIKNLLEDTTLVVVSNRGKYNAKVGKDGKITYGESAGGLANAMDNALMGTGGTWISWSGEKQKLDLPELHEPKEAGYGVAHINIDEKDYDVFYNTVANGILWPVMHCINDQVDGYFEEYKENITDKDWDSYRKVNQEYADSALKQLKNKQGQKKDNLVWVQDYQLLLVPGMIREGVKEDEGLKDTKIGYFHHIPFPKPDIYINSMGEEKAKETVSSLLKNDVIGFHVPSYVNNFMNTVKKLDMQGVKVDKESKTVTTTDPATGKTHTAIIKEYPISLDVQHLQEQVQSEAVQAKMDEIMKNIKKQNPETEYVIFAGAERADYTKNLANRVDSVEKFLSDLPKDERKKYTTIFLIAPSRLDIPSYKKNYDTVMRKIENVNKNYGQKNHKSPIIRVGQVPYMEVGAYMRLADVVIVTPVVDGMNLAAKEAPVMKVLDKDRPYELVLTKNAGIGQDPVFQKDCMMIEDPLNVRETAEQIQHALYNLRNRGEDVAKRNKDLLEHVQDWDINKWTKNFINDLKN